jgi:hypothetical protein
MVRFACRKKHLRQQKITRQQMTEAKNGSFRKRKVKRLGSLETSPETT